MCTNYTPTSRDRLRAMRLGEAELPARDWPPEVFPGYEAPIIRSASPTGRGSAGARTDADSALGGLKAANAVLARFGLVPRWSRDTRQAMDISRGTYNARSETAHEKPSFRGPWREQRFALAPMAAFFEPCWESGRAVRWRIQRADGEPFAVAALWEAWTERSTGEILTSFSLLTVNADAHPLMRRMHKPGDEKRMLVLVPPQRWFEWLQATPEQASDFMRCAADGELVAEPAPLPARGKPPAAPKPQAAHPPPPGTQNPLFE